MSFDALEHLKFSSLLLDGQLDIAKTALALAVRPYNSILVPRILTHFDVLAREVRGRHHDLVLGGARDDCATRLASLKHVLSDKFGYEGYEDSGHIDYSDLIRVVDTRKGLSLCIAILAAHCAHAQDWEFSILKVPGPVVCRMEYLGTRLLFHPGNKFCLLGAADLRVQVKEAIGQSFELSSSYFEPFERADILINLQNIVKWRQIEAADYLGALETIERMRVFRPQEFRLLLDAGVLYAKTQQVELAIRDLQSYITIAPSGRDLRDAVLLLEQLKSVNLVKD